MNVYNETLHEKDRIMSDAILVAYAVTAILGRKEDDISEHEARKIYDSGWLKDRTNRGLLHFSRKGNTKCSAKIYSRFEIESLKRAEKHVEKNFNDALIKVREMQKMENQELS